MTPPFERIEYVPSLQSVQRKLKAAGDEFDGAVKALHKGIAEDVADEVRAKYQSHYDQPTGAGAKSIRALATIRRSQVAIGSKKAPYVPGQNFGSNARSMRRFAPKGSPDRFLYATFEDQKSDMAKRHAKMIDELMKAAYPEGGPTLG